MVEHCVTAVFNGHDHCYEHANPGNGVHYFVTVGGGGVVAGRGVRPVPAWGDPVLERSDPDDEKMLWAARAEWLRGLERRGAS